MRELPCWLIDITVVGCGIVDDGGDAIGVAEEHANASHQPDERMLLQRTQCIEALPRLSLVVSAGGLGSLVEFLKSYRQMQPLRLCSPPRLLWPSAMRRVT